MRQIILKGKVKLLKLKSRVSEKKIHLRDSTIDFNCQNEELADLRIKQ